MDEKKKAKIKEALEVTKKRRKEQIVRVYQVKLQNLSNSDVEKLNRLFLEAKWLYNYTIADVENRLKESAWKLKEVEVKTPEGFENLHP